MDTKALHEANRKGWNEGAAAYWADLEDRVAFLKAGGTNFCAPEYAYLANLGEWCERAIHLQCAGGTDTLSLLNLGAREVVGVDISDEMIAVATAKSQALGANASWYRCDLLETPHELDATADLVYTGRGALCWIMDLDAWARVVFRLLKPGGRLYVFEGHPIAFVWQLEAAEFKLDPGYGDYFKETPLSDSGWPTTYIGDLGKPKEEHAVKYEHQWTVAQILNALTTAGMVFERMGEHPDCFWEAFPNIAPDVVRRLPQTFSLLMRKPSV